MSQESRSPENPSPFEAFAPPSVSSVQIDRGPYPQHQPILKMFRQQMLALGVLWVLLGALGGVGGAVIVGASLGVLGPAPDGYPVAIGYVAIVIGAVWTFAGVGTLMKRMGAVWVGLVMSYLSLLGNLLSINVCMIVLTVLVLVQAHRVIGFAAKLRAAGVPLDAKA